MRIDREHRIMLHLVKCSLEHGTARDLDELFREDINWDYFIDFSVYHGVSHLLNRFFEMNSGLPVPGNVVEVFEGEYLANTALHILHSRVLKELVHLFHGSGIAFTVHKGLALASLLYEEPELRPCGGDIDVFLKKQDYPRARKLLVETGYRPLYPEYESHEIEYIGEVKFAGEFGGREVVIDLHTDLVANHWGKVTRFDMPGFWERLMDVEHQGFRMPSLPVDAYFFFLCIHCAANHIFDRLITFCDLDLFVRKFKDRIDWTQAAHQARERGATKVVYHALNYCRVLLETPVPVGFMHNIRPGLLSRALVPSRALIFRDTSPPKSLERTMHLVLLDNPVLAFRSIGIFLSRILNEFAIKKRRDRKKI